jgi:hypothetical protein
LYDTTFPSSDSHLECFGVGPLGTCGGVYVDPSPGDVVAVELVSLGPPQEVVVACMSLLTDDPQSFVVSCTNPVNDAYIGVVLRPVLESLVPETP